MNKQDYLAKLRDPRWQKKRLEIFNRDGFTCQQCFETNEMLDVHHMVYFKGDPWDTPNEHLITLCHTCHEEETTEREELDRRLLKIMHSKFLGYDIELLIGGLERLQFDVKDRNFTAEAIMFLLMSPEISRILTDIYSKMIDEFEKKS